ncbi:predicted protein [Thalassiosira pseudonana CCMP1335]|uniref:RxLR effector protein n=1 Tax=Thalassiosira pseudonana TaxID=35128 RepID=B8C9N8_THAPS|nr:predicted protein [Thalassiosira pseudonana CCMP1335]EED89891.1 predicted protein [Thalassiosira pseudonana CCMP1335]|eukprot:scaffold6912_cov197-Alexandrium_tamarense.AAC.3
MSPRFLVIAFALLALNDVAFGRLGYEGVRVPSFSSAGEVGKERELSLLDEGEKEKIGADFKVVERPDSSKFWENMRASALLPEPKKKDIEKKHESTKPGMLRKLREVSEDEKDLVDAFHVVGRLKVVEGLKTTGMLGDGGYGDTKDDP